MDEQRWPSDKKIYRSYLLRCWFPRKLNPGDPSDWRVVLETVSNEPRRRGFDTFEELVAFLQAELLNPKRERQ